MSESCPQCQGDRHAAPAGAGRAPSVDASRPLRESLFRIEQMDCPTEERLLRKALESLHGVHTLSFDLIQRTLKVGHVLDDPQPIMAAIAGLNMSPVLLEDGSPAAAGEPAALLNRQVQVALHPVALACRDQRTTHRAGVVRIAGPQ